ncbi:MAG TPA: P-II family nitrogen regulator [Vicinamibacterales bacterium]
MKLVSSLVRACRLEAIKEALNRVNVVALSVVEARDYAPQQHATTAWRGRLYALESSMKLEVQVIVHDDDVDEVVDLVIRAARTGTSGDGHICIMPVDHRYSISTGRREV